METHLGPLDSAPIAGQRSPLPRIRILRRFLTRFVRHIEVSMIERRQTYDEKDQNSESRRKLGKRGRFALSAFLNIEDLEFKTSTE